VEKSEGVMVVEVEPHSLADRKDIRAGDIITQVNQKPVNSVKQFTEALKNAGTEKGVVLQFLSQGTRKFEILRDVRD
jgi:S1-C subfamily serine protease